MSSPRSLLLVVSLLAFLPIISAQDAAIPFLHFAHPGYEEPSYFQKYEALLGADYMKRCVRRRDPPPDGSSCRKLPKACLWGNQTCELGGETPEPSTRCNCQDRLWSCQGFLCPTILDGTCPAESPAATTPEPICGSDVRCNYGDQTCCGLSFATEVCTCQTGTGFTCVQFDICSFPCDRVIAFFNSEEPNELSSCLPDNVDAPSVLKSVPYARRAFSKIYGTASPEEFPTWISKDLSGEPGKYNCSALEGGLDCEIEVIEFLQSTADIWALADMIVAADDVATLDSNGTPISAYDYLADITEEYELGPPIEGLQTAAQLQGIEPFAFIGRLVGPNGASQEAGMIAWTSTVIGEGHVFLVLFESAAFFPNDSNLTRRDFVSESVSAAVTGNGGTRRLPPQDLAVQPWCFSNVVTEVLNLKSLTAAIQEIDSECAGVDDFARAIDPLSSLIWIVVVVILVGDQGGSPSSPVFDPASAPASSPVVDPASSPVLSPINQ